MTTDVMSIAKAVRACELVFGLHPGRSGTIVTDGGGRRLVGVRRDREIIVVGVIGARGVNSVLIVNQVRDAVAAIEPGSPVSVRIEVENPADRHCVGP